MQPVMHHARQVRFLAFGLLVFLIGCQGVKSPTPSGPQTGNQATLQSSINHIVVLMQENRSFDSYFGQLPAYWAANNIPAQQFDGMPANASNPSFDGLSTISAFHLRTQCFENVSPSWNESHVQWNRQSPTSSTATMDGYVFTAAKFSRTPKPPSEGTFVDVEGFRAMGYYDASDLNYYYFMATNFATSDRWFSPIMTRTQANRLYLYAATSAGHVYSPAQPLTTKTIFELLDAAGVSWKIYETDPGTTFLQFFQPYGSQHAANVVPVSEYLTDVQNGTLPSVAFIEGGYESGRDEHPNNNVQTGAAYVASLINALMNSPSWNDSVFILTYDEGGGIFDHVPPVQTVSPDGIPPSDLQPDDICTVNGGANCDFTVTGFRVPLIVVSPFTRKNFVSHTPADYTAILKLIETRFSLGSLTQRDAAQMDMTEFFDFNNPVWMTPPTPPDQVTNGLCDFQALP
jgi:phospholipase C